MSNNTILEYDDHNLQEWFKAMNPKNRAKVLRGMLRQESTRVLKVAKDKVTGRFGGRRDMGKGLVRTVYRDNAVGFKVGVSPKAKKAMHLNRRALLKPVLFWAAIGTGERRNRRGKRLGKMPYKGFLADTDAAVEGSVMANMREEATKEIIKIAKKYGAEV